MKYTVVHSTDPYLLARLATDLQMSGIEKRSPDTITFNPFDENLPLNEWCYINDIPGTFNFGCHPGVPKPDRHELTESNYLQVLESVLS